MINGGALINDIIGGTLINDINGGILINDIIGGTLINDIIGGTLINDIIGGTLINDIIIGRILINDIIGGTLINDIIIGGILINHIIIGGIILINEIIIRGIILTNSWRVSPIIQLGPMELMMRQGAGQLGPMELMMRQRAWQLGPMELMVRQRAGKLGPMELMVRQRAGKLGPMELMVRQRAGKLGPMELMVRQRAGKLGPMELMVRQRAGQLGPIELMVCHLGGGISLGLHFRIALPSGGAVVLQSTCGPELWFMERRLCNLLHLKLQLEPCTLSKFINNIEFRFEILLLFFTQLGIVSVVKHSECGSCSLVPCHLNGGTTSTEGVITEGECNKQELLICGERRMMPLAARYDRPSLENDNIIIIYLTSKIFIATLIDSDKFKRVISSIRTIRQGGDPGEYQLTVDANNLVADIDNEIKTIYNFIKTIYSKRLPNLDTIVPNVLDYIYTAKEIANDLDNVRNNYKLIELVSQPKMMAISILASTIKSQLLSQEELNRIYESCDMADELNNFKKEIYTFVESQMCYIAPNLSAIVGTSIAAQLMGMAGGLDKLARYPSCNVLLMGAENDRQWGISATEELPHAGLIYKCCVVLKTPLAFRRKIARHLANKCVLAARVDCSHEYKDGSFGLRMREEAENKLEKFLAPPPVKQIKPLPAPIELPKNKRGGRRARKMKERYAPTELRKRANRMTFAAIDEDAYQEDLGLSLGQIKKGGTGRIRAAQVDEKTKVKISKTLKKRDQGWERKAESKINKYFSNTAGFQHVGNK
ncbi:PRPF31 [Cordylochernes scorpioides]|uniref:U4/U6 small nuclear ribonucleoprotein Prp31 n=1 Tax=Cordylochernes scorpioides TaxID=51811 RepID=A0ABY6JY87_9ARAC|nr:PRPF31 [Cordylochernes scorpioides]